MLVLGPPGAPTLAPVTQDHPPFGFSISQASGRPSSHCMSVSALCLEFGPNDCRVILKPRQGYVPKVLSTPFRAQVIPLLALPNSEADQFGL